MKPALFIINPKAGKQGRNLQIFQKFNTDFADSIFTEYAEHATILTKKAIQTGYKYIIAVGGDGTVNEIATALLHTNCVLGIVPMGSGNGLARELGFSMNIEICILQIKNAIETQSVNLIDAGVLDFASERKYFFCTAGIGFDAHCAAMFAQKGSKRGLRNYIKIAWQEFWNYKCPQIKYNGEEKIIFTLTFANAKQFGNNAYIAPEAKINDGFLHVTELQEAPIWANLFIIWRLFKQTIHRSSYVKTSKGKSFVVESEQKIVAHYDGEPLQINDKELKINILASVLNVLKVG